MRLICDPVCGEVDLTASAEELNRLADAVAEGEGLLSSAPSPGNDALVGIEVEKTMRPRCPCPSGFRAAGPCDQR